MKANYLWFKHLLGVDISAEQLANDLTSIGFEVVSLKRVNTIPQGLVIGEVLEKKKHFNAEKLNVVEIAYRDKNQEKLRVEVVCGASNIESGQKIVFAPVDTRLSEQFVIKKTKIRGIFSHGMVCSRAEVGKEEKSEGIWVLPESASIEDDLTKYWGEENVIYDVDVPSNRPDCQSMVGLLYDLAGFYQKKIKSIRLSEIFSASQGESKQKNESSFDCGLGLKANEAYLEKSSFLSSSGTKINVSQPLTLDVNVQYDRTICYLARRVHSTKVEPSPLWLQEQLFFHDLRPINNVVDVTNWMMLCYGQPMHAFDADKITEKTLKIRSARDKEKFVDLREEEIDCCAADIVVADAKNPVALAGVIGGSESAVSEKTTEIIFEAAVFPTAEVTQTSRYHNIVTDSSKFFERKVYGERTAFVLDQAVQLLLDIGALDKDAKVGVLCGKKFDVYDQTSVVLRFSQLRKILQLSFEPKQMETLFSFLNAKVTLVDDEKIEVIPPFFRRDLVYEWDLIEEVARIFGYDKIEKRSIPIVHKDRDFFSYSQQKIKNTAVSLGYDETITFPIVEQGFLQQAFSNLEKKGFEGEGFVKISNPMHAEFQYLRQDMLYGMLKTLKSNVERHFLETFRFFEYGHVFSQFVEKSGEKNYQERENIGFLLAKKIEAKKNRLFEDSEDTAKNYNEHDFFYLKGDLEAFAHSLGAEVHDFLYEEAQWYYSYPYASAVIRCDQEVLGKLSLIRDDFLSFFDLDGWRVFYGELNLDAKAFKVTKKPCFQKISPFPSVMRDIALVVDEKQLVADMLKSIKNAIPLVENVSLVEVYSGRGIKDGKKSFIFRVQLRSKKETLSNERADAIILQIVEKLKKSHSFELR